VSRGLILCTLYTPLITARETRHNHPRAAPSVGHRVKGARDFTSSHERAFLREKINKKHKKFLTNIYARVILARAYPSAIFHLFARRACNIHTVARCVRDENGEDYVSYIMLRVVGVVRASTTLPAREIRFRKSLRTKEITSHV